MHILIAPNAFKNSLGAAKVAEAIENGLRQSKLSCTTTRFPVADGGDGTADLLIDYLNAERVAITVHDPLCRKINSFFGWAEIEKTAIIELAAASGLRLLQPSAYNPLIATTYGTGELMVEALNRNTKKIILCIGGSATVDGASGILKALGVKFFDVKGNELNDLPASLSLLGSIDVGSLDKRISQAEIIILCDVENLLLGQHGAAAVFGPQKGATENDVRLLEARLKKLSDAVLNSTGKDISTIKHAGASGGVAGVLHGLLNARLVNGIDYFLEITNFQNELARANMVITGEGSIDLQTLHGKAPFGVAKKAKELSIPVIGMAGIIPGHTEQSLSQYFDQLISINEENTDLRTAMRNTYLNLEKAARHFGDRTSMHIVQN